MKKIGLLFIFIAFTFLVKAQTDSRIFYSQLMVVISDLETNFEYLKGAEISKQNGVSFYEAIRFLEGTKDNLIVIDSASSQYQAIIVDSTSREGSQLMLDSWKDKLNSALSGMFSPATALSSSSDANTSGYQFSSKKITVLLLRHKLENGAYWINLVIKPRR